MKKLNKLFSVLLCMLVLIAAFAVPAGAAGEIDPSAECSLTINYVDGKTPLSGVLFRVYYVADISEDAEFTAAGSFKEYPIDFTELTVEANWAELALTLAGYVERDVLQPAANVETDENGAICMEHMQAGLYLVLGSAAEADGMIYTAIPALVSLPSMNEAGEYFYNVTIFPKHESNPVEAPISIRVLKTWDDKGTVFRPKEITVDLLCDGEVVDSVTLNKDCKWTHTWEELDADHSWNVSEHPVEGYTVKVEKNNRTFKITNTGDYPPPPPPPYNPQTGLLWWPVPVLLGAGLLFIVLALIRRKKSTEA